MDMKQLGAWSFIGGVVLALIIGLAAAFMTIDAAMKGIIYGIMVVLGILVGALNITEKEVTSFVIAALGLAMGSAALASLGVIIGSEPGQIITTAFTVFGLFVAGAVFIPSLKAVYAISKS